MPVQGGVGGAQAFGPASGGKVTAFNNINTTFTQVVAQNTFRQSITFANPGTITLYVGPMTQANGSPNAPTTSLLGGTFPLFGGAMVTITGECQQAWGIMSASSSSLPATVMGSNVA